MKNRDTDSLLICCFITVDLYKKRGNEIEKLKIITVNPVRRNISNNFLSKKLFLKPPGKIIFYFVTIYNLFFRELNQIFAAPFEL